MAFSMPSQGSAAMELSVDLGPMPPDPLLGGAIEGGGLRALLDRREFCDVVLVAGGQSFSAHSLVLAAVSPSFHQQIQQEHAKGEHGVVAGMGRKPVTIHLDNVSHA